MKKLILRLTRLFTATATITGIALHPANKLVDGVSGATRQKQQVSKNTNTSDTSTTTINDDSTTSNNSTDSTSLNRPTIASPSTIISPINNSPIAIGWVKEGTDWTYVREDTSKATAWLNTAGKWYYLSSNGVMLTGWIKAGEYWYYLASSGEMQTGWIKDISGSWYYLDNSGAMLSNTSIGGYTLGSNGRML